MFHGEHFVPEAAPAPGSRVLLAEEGDGAAVGAGEEFGLVEGEVGGEGFGELPGLGGPGEQEAGRGEKGSAINHFGEVSDRSTGGGVVVLGNEILDSLGENSRVLDRHRAYDMSQERSPLAARLE